MAKRLRRSGIIENYVRSTSPPSFPLKIRNFLDDLNILKAYLHTHTAVTAGVTRVVAVRAYGLHVDGIHRIS